MATRGSVVVSIVWTWLKKIMWWKMKKNVGPIFYELSKLLNKLYAIKRFVKEVLRWEPLGTRIYFFMYQMHSFENEGSPLGHMRVNNIKCVHIITSTNQ